MLQAMNTGHDGSLSTVHANTPRDALARIETMVLMAGYDLPVRAIRQQVSSAVELIVHIERLQDGSRRVTSVTEVQRMEADTITLQELFAFGIDRVLPDVDRASAQADGSSPGVRGEVREAWAGAPVSLVRAPPFVACSRYGRRRSVSGFRVTLAGLVVLLAAAAPRPLQRRDSLPWPIVSGALVHPDAPEAGRGDGCIGDPS